MTPAAGASPSGLFEQARKAYHSGDLHGALRAFEELLGSHPEQYDAYPTYWVAVGKAEASEAQRRAIESSLSWFDTVPADRRSEEFYGAYLTGCEILSASGRGGLVRQEAAARFPRGLVAQQLLLEKARDAGERDPRDGVALYRDYLDRFDDNVSWCEMASKGIVDLMAAHPDRFNPDELRAAAVRAERDQTRSIEVFGEPLQYVLLMKRLGEVFTPRDPTAALEHLKKGLSYVQEQWPGVDPGFEENRRILWPGLLEANTALGKWKVARTVGEALTRLIQTGEMEFRAEEESRIRTEYAKALEQMGQAEAAAVQKSLAVDPEKAFALREDALRGKVLATQQRRLAADFALQDLAGRTIRLGDYRGKVLVLSESLSRALPWMIEAAKR